MFHQKTQNKVEEMWGKQEKDNNSLLPMFAWSVGDVHMSGGNDIIRLEAMQLPNSVFHFLSFKIH